MIVAHHLKVPAPGGRPRTLAEAAEALGVAERAASVLLTVCTSLGLLELRDGRYALTPVAEDYLLEDSPTYFGYWSIATGRKP